jgi:uncharacterized Zn finger protein
MASFSRTWWGKKFIEALEKLMDSGRLSRGRSYARNGKILKFEINKGKIAAKVRGSINPYFGVYEEPLYTTTIEFEPIAKAQWSQAIAHIASKASFVSRLLLNEIPENIEDGFRGMGLNLLPQSRKDLKAKCSCPDSSNPCKHIAGVYFLLAAELDNDPFLLFELRGLSRQALKTELEKSPLGQALSAELEADNAPPTSVASYYCRPQVIGVTGKEVPMGDRLEDFWHGPKRLPQTVHSPSTSPISAVLVKKQGDFPAFWPRDNSFIAVMEELYQRVKTRNKDLL